MVINGGSRSGLASYVGYLGWHLQRRDTNELVNIRELRGVVAPDLAMALDELAAMGIGSRSQRPLYHANIDWKHDEVLTEPQKVRAVERLAEELGLADQPRLVVEHVKNGRAHLHVVWLRIDPATGTAISDSHNYRSHEIVARDLEREFGLDRVQGVHIERDGIERPARTPAAFEFAQAERSGFSPADAKAELTRLWQMADTGAAFALALDDAGWTLARGDKRDFVVLDMHGETHSLGRRLDGVKAKDVRDRLADIDPLMLPSVDEARQVIRDRQPATPEPVPVPSVELGGMDLPAPSPEATQRPSYEVDPEPVAAAEPEMTMSAGIEAVRPQPEPQPEPSVDLTLPDPDMRERRARAVGEIIAAAWHRLTALGDRLERAFGLVRDQAAEAKPAPQAERKELTVDNGAVILEAMRQPERKGVADDLLDAGRRRRREQPEPELKPELDLSRSIWDDFGKRKRRPGDFTP